MDFGIFSLVGRQGQGKTIGSVALSYFVATTENRPIASNMSSLQGLSVVIKSFSQLFELKGYVILLDELYHDLDSRSFAKNVAKSEWCSQIRKLDQVVFYNTQQFQKIDNRLRDETQYVIDCKKLGNDIHKLTVYDALDYASGIFIPTTVKHLNVSQMYGKYDTKQVIHSLSN